MSNSGIFTNRVFDEVNYFNPWKVNMEYNDIFVKGIPFVFMTTPPLNLTEVNVQSDSFLTYMCNSSTENLNIARHMTNRVFTDDLFGALSSSTSRMIPLVTNRSLSCDTKDTVSRTKEVGESFYGYKQVHPGSLVDSIVGDEFSIKYLESANLSIIKMHKLWQDYIEKIRRGSFMPSKKSIEDGYIDYMVSVYYILCDFDGETIKYWCKYTGVTPLNVPYSNLGGEMNAHDIPDVTINYQYCFKEDLSPAILRDFNRVVTNDEGSTNLKWFKGKDSSDSSVSNKSLITKRTETYEGDNGGNFFYEKTLQTGFEGGLTPKIWSQKNPNGGDYQYKLKFY